MKNTKHMAWAIIIALFILWLLGFSINIGGNLIHTLLIIAIVVFAVRLLY